MTGYGGEGEQDRIDKTVCVSWLANHTPPDAKHMVGQLVANSREFMDRKQPDKPGRVDRTAFELCLN